MNQTLRQMLGNVKNKMDVEKKVDESKKEDKPKPLTFFEKHLPGLRDGSTVRNFQTVKTVANERADAFIRSVRSPVHPDHEKNVAEFFGKYGGDYEKIHKSFLDAASDELQYPDPEDCKQDPNYEARIAAQYKPKSGANHDDTAFYNILLDTLQRSREANGYGRDKCYDNAAISGWKIKYHRPQ